MTVPSWPDTLPAYVVRDGFLPTFPDGRLLTKTDAGPGQGRKNNPLPAWPLAGQLPCSTPDEAEILFDFWTDDLAGGLRPFLLPNQIVRGTPGTPTVPAAGYSPFDALWWLVKFGERPPSMPPWAKEGFLIPLDLWVLP